MFERIFTSSVLVSIFIILFGAVVRNGWASDPTTADLAESIRKLDSRIEKLESQVSDIAMVRDTQWSCSATCGYIYNGVILNKGLVAASGKTAEEAIAAMSAKCDKSVYIDYQLIGKYLTLVLANIRNSCVKN